MFVVCVPPNYIISIHFMHWMVHDWLSQVGIFSKGSGGGLANSHQRPSQREVRMNPAGSGWRPGGGPVSLAGLVTALRKSPVRAGRAGDS